MIFMGINGIININPIILIGVLPMGLNRADILKGIDQLGIESKIVCIHSSLKSFGFVEGGAQTIVNAFLDEGYTILAPTFSMDYLIHPPKDDRPLRNGCNYENYSDNFSHSNNIFTTKSQIIDRESMGAIPYEILKMPNRDRGYNPLNSFTAIGPRSKELVSEQSPIDVYAPLRKLYELDGYIILMGVDLTRMTAIHYAEELAGRNLFIRWAKGLDGQPIRVSVGSCSKGFNNFNPLLKNTEKRVWVGESLWRIFPMRKVVDLCTEAIRDNQMITHCGNDSCEKCRDAVQGGPIL